jgi:hypothetical protein
MPLDIALFGIEDLVFVATILIFAVIYGFSYKKKLSEIKNIPTFTESIKCAFSSFKLVFSLFCFVIFILLMSRLLNF